MWLCWLLNLNMFCQLFSKLCGVGNIRNYWGSNYNLSSWGLENQMAQGPEPFDEIQNKRQSLLHTCTFPCIFSINFELSTSHSIHLPNYPLSCTHLYQSINHPIPREQWWIKIPFHLLKRVVNKGRWNASVHYSRSVIFLDACTGPRPKNPNPSLTLQCRINSIRFDYIYSI